HDGVAVVVQRRQQAALADDERGAVRLELGEEAGGRHRAGEDVLLADVDAEPLQSRGDVAARALAVVGQEAEGHPRRKQLVDEAVRAGDQRPPPVDDPVHVDQVAVHARVLLPQKTPLAAARGGERYGGWRGVLVWSKDGAASGERRRENPVTPGRRADG